MQGTRMHIGCGVLESLQQGTHLAQNPALPESKRTHQQACQRGALWLCRPSALGALTCCRACSSAACCSWRSMRCLGRP